MSNFERRIRREINSNIIDRLVEQGDLTPLQGDLVKYNIDVDVIITENQARGLEGYRGVQTSEELASELLGEKVVGPVTPEEYEKYVATGLAETEEQREERERLVKDGVIGVGKDQMKWTGKVDRSDANPRSLLGEDFEL